MNLIVWLIAKIIYAHCAVDVYVGRHQDLQGWMEPRNCDAIVRDAFDTRRELTRMINDKGQWIESGDNQHYTIMIETCRCH